MPMNIKYLQNGSSLCGSVKISILKWFVTCAHFDKYANNMDLQSLIVFINITGTLNKDEITITTIIV